MKRVQKAVSMFALALGLTVALGFNARANKSFTNYWFDTTAAGVPTSYNPDGAQCSQASGDYCSKEYAASQLNFSGGVPVSVKAGQENLQILAERKGN